MKFPRKFYAPDDGGSPPPAAPPASVSPSGSGAPNPVGQGVATTETRPDYVPEQFWNTETKGIRIKELAQSYAELRSKFDGKLEPLKAEWQKEFETNVLEQRKGEWEQEWRTKADSERLASRPSKPEAYEIALDKLEVPEGVTVKFDEQDPLMKFWREFCYEKGYDGETFNAGVKQFIGQQLTKLPNREVEVAKLGEKGPQRVERVNLWAKANLSDNAYATLDKLVSNAAGVEAFEEIMAKLGEPMVLPEVSGDLGGGMLTMAKLRDMQNDPRYWDWSKRDAAFVKQVDEGFARLRPGQRKVAY
jgi:hypothetical protein